jgi:aminopeptidase YwaD
VADQLDLHVEGHVRDLCAMAPDRHVGSAGNNEAVAYFERVVGGFGFDVEAVGFDCVEWEFGDSNIKIGDHVQRVHAGPYSELCDVRAPLTEVSSVEDLEDRDFTGSVLLVHGELARETLMPKNFEFYNPESHRRIIAAIENSQPAAVIAATGMNPELAGGVCPFPLIEDADFDIPSAFMLDVDGAELVAAVGSQVHLSIDSRRVPARARQLVARKSGSGVGRIGVFAHIDAKKGSPGALDNASGVAAILGLAELLADYRGERDIEIVPFNGEDYYAAPGQVLYLEANRGRFGDMALAFNVDGAGFAGERTAVSLYECPDQVASSLRATIDGRPGFFEGPQWPQGDHSLLAMNGVPTVAVTSENVFFIAQTVAHTAQDVPELVDFAAVAGVSRFMRDAIAALP